MGVLHLPYFVVHYFVSFPSCPFAIILRRKREQVALFLLSYGGVVYVYVLLLFPVPKVGLHCVIVVFPDHTYLLFVVICWESADLLALLYVMVYCVFVIFPCDVLGQIWYLIASIPDLRLLIYFVHNNFLSQLKIFFVTLT